MVLLISLPTFALFCGLACTLLTYFDTNSSVLCECCCRNGEMVSVNSYMIRSMFMWDIESYSRHPESSKFEWIPRRDGMQLVGILIPLSVHCSPLGERDCWMHLVLQRVKYRTHAALMICCTSLASHNDVINILTT